MPPLAVTATTLLQVLYSNAIPKPQARWVTGCKCSRCENKWRLNKCYFLSVSKETFYPPLAEGCGSTRLWRSFPKPQGVTTVTKLAANNARTEVLSFRTLDPRFPPGAAWVADRKENVTATYQSWHLRQETWGPAHASRGSAETQRGSGRRVTTCGRGRSSTPAGLAGHHVEGGGGASARSFLGGHDYGPEARCPGEAFLPHLTWAGLGWARALAGLGFHTRNRFSHPEADSGVAVASAFSPEVCALWLEVLGSAVSPARLRAARNSANRCSMARALRALLGARSATAKLGRSAPAYPQPLLRVRGGAREGAARVRRLWR